MMANDCQFCIFTVFIKKWWQMIANSAFLQYSSKNGDKWLPILHFYSIHQKNDGKWLLILHFYSNKHCQFTKISPRGKMTELTIGPMLGQKYVGVYLHKICFTLLAITCLEIPYLGFLSSFFVILSSFLKVLILAHWTRGEIHPA